MHGGFSAGGTFIISGTRSAVITVIVIHVGIVDNGGPVVNVRAVSAIVSVHIAMIHAVVWQKRPVASGNIDVYADMYAGSHRCPSIVAAATSPGHPCRCPFVTGNPGPPVIVVVIPSPVMERCPSPRVVRYPGVTIVGHHPVAVGRVRMKVSSDIGNPHPAISAVVDPPAVRPQLIVENIERNAAIMLIAIVIIFVIAVVISLRIHTSLRSEARGKRQCDYREKERVS